MKCKVCKEKLILREGKFGSFWACVNSTPSDNHGTVSTSAADFVDDLSDNELKRLKKKRKKLLKELRNQPSMSIRRVSLGTPDLDFDQEVRLTMARDFSYNMSDHEVFMDYESGHEEHWSNQGRY